MGYLRHEEEGEEEEEKRKEEEKNKAYLEEEEVIIAFSLTHFLRHGIVFKRNDCCHLWHCCHYLYSLLYHPSFKHLHLATAYHHDTDRLPALLLPTAIPTPLDSAYSFSTAHESYPHQTYGLHHHPNNSLKKFCGMKLLIYLFLFSNFLLR